MKNLLILCCFLQSSSMLAQSGLHVKWMNNEEVIYYDRTGTIWAHNIESDKRRELLKGSQPAPHPTESDTYAIRSKSDGNSAIIIVDARSAVRINASKGMPAELKAFHPMWSRDGSLLAFHGENGPDKSVLFIYDYVNKTLKSHLEDLIVGAPSFFPNGDILTTILSEEGSTMIRYNLKTGESQELMRSEHKIYFSDPSPDGKTIAFTFKESGNLDIWLLDISTGKLSQLTDTPHDEWGPRWSPSGKQLTYFAEIGGNPAFVLDADGKNIIRLTR